MSLRASIAIVALALLSPLPTPATAREAPSRWALLNERMREIEALADPDSLKPWPWTSYAGVAPREDIKAALNLKLRIFRGDWRLRLELAKVRLAASLSDLEGPSKYFRQIVEEIEAAKQESPQDWVLGAAKSARYTDVYDESLYLGQLLKLKVELRRWENGQEAAAEVAESIRSFIDRETQPLFTSTGSAHDLVRFRSFANLHPRWGEALLTTLILANHEAKGVEEPSTDEMVAASDALVALWPGDPWAHFWRGLVEWQSPFRRLSARGDFERGIECARRAMEDLAARGPSPENLVALGSLTERDLDVLMSPAWLFSDRSAADRELAVRNYMEDVGGLTGYRAHLMEAEIRFGIPGISKRRGWDNRIGRDIVKYRNQIESVASDVGGTSEADTAEEALRRIGEPSQSDRIFWLGGGSESVRVQTVFEDHAAPSLRVKFKGESGVHVYDQFGAGATERVPSTKTKGTGDNAYQERVDAFNAAMESQWKEIEADRRRAEEKPPWWSTVSPIDIERTSFLSQSKGDLFPVPYSIISVALILPVDQDVPKELDASLELYDASQRPYLKGTWRLNVGSMETGEVEGPVSISVETRELPSHQVAMVFDVVTRQIPPGRYVPWIHLADSGGLRVGTPLQAIEVQAPSTDLQLSDITLLWQGKDESVAASPMNLIWEGQRSLIARVDLHNLTLPDQGPPGYELRYAIFPRDAFDPVISSRIRDAHGGALGRSVAEEDLAASVGGGWIERGFVGASLPQVLPVSIVDSAGVDHDLQQDIVRQRSVTVSANLEIGQDLGPGFYVLLIEAADGISGAVTHQRMDFVVVPSDYVIPPPRID